MEKKRATPMRIIKRILNIAGLIILAALFILPFLWMILTAVKSFAETMTYPPVFFPSELHFENFVKAWKSGPFLKYFLNSCIVDRKSVV